MANKPTKKKPAKKKTTKKGKYIRFTDKVKNVIKLLARRGFTDADMSKIIGITEQTFNNWKKRYAEFFVSLNDWKELPDSEVERSLFERACGYTHPEVHVSNYQGKITLTPLEKHYPPDPTSMIFWLKNRQPKKWRDKREVGLTDQEGKDLNWAVEIVGVKENNSDG